jgi:outer membrane protein assembly factor BamA
MVGGFYTENNSWGVMALEMARLAHDRFRLRGMVGHMEINYNFFGVGEAAGEAGQSIRIDQTINMGIGSALVRTFGQLYAGVSFAYMDNTINLPDSLLAILPPSALDRARTTLFAPGLQLEYDTRNNDYWPQAGNWFTLKSSFFGTALGGERKFQRYMPYWSHYFRLAGDRALLVTNINACAAAGNTPFYALCSVGAGMGGLRGYTQGRYRDTVMTTAQTEVRLHGAGRLGAVAFAGFGMVAPNVGDILNARVLPAGGLGVRFQLTKEYPMHLRLDYAWGRDEGLLYFGVAEAF